MDQTKLPESYFTTIQLKNYSDYMLAVLLLLMFICYLMFQY